ncbi:MAG: sigma-70 family RNA polymerase sigma factor [Peptococcaceae bacterium]|nr:sigma-70 family RNA polymerase sigma factor [Peptococcaceae bacterium]
MRLPVEMLVERYHQNLFAVAFNVCKNREDAEEVVQDAFIQYHLKRLDFQSEEHIRAWLIRVTINKAKNAARTFWWRHRTSLEETMAALTFDDQESERLFEAVIALPQKYRIVVHLFYYEDYSVHEMAELLSLSESNVKTRLSRARAMLRDTLKEVWSDDE